MPVISGVAGKVAKERVVDRKALQSLMGPGCNAFPGYVLEYRTLHSVSVSTIRNLELPLSYCPTLNHNRVFPFIDFRTATGRVKFSSPNLQNIPKDITLAVSAMWLPISLSSCRSANSHCGSTLVCSCVY